VKFVLEGSDDEEVWATVGSSTSVSYFEVVAFTHGAANVPKGRGLRHEIDARMNVLHILGNPVAHLLMYLGIVSSLCLAASGAYRLAGTGLVGTLAHQFVYRLCIGLLLYLQEQREGLHHAHSAYTIALGIDSLWKWLVLAFFRMGVDLPLLFTVQPIMQIFLHRQLFGTAFSLRPAAGNFLQSVTVIGVGLVVLVIRVRTVLLAQRRVAAAKAIYDEEWQRVCRKQRADVERLGRTVTRLQLGCRNIKAQQLYPTKWLAAVTNPSTRRGSIAAWASLLISGEHRRPSTAHGSSSLLVVPLIKPSTTRVAPASPPIEPAAPSELMMRTDALDRARVVDDAADQSEERESFFASSVLQSKTMAHALMNVRCTPAMLDRPVETLDQLHSQAFLVQDIFQSWVVDLARRTEGKFRLREPSVDGDGAERVFEAWNGEGDTRKRFKLGNVKRVSSAMIKLDMAYNDDVSRLLDMCRETLYFESVALLEGCLNDLGRDEMVDVVLVKNSMHAAGVGSRQGEKDELWAGLPFVRVNVRMAGSEEARGLCVDAHVCELMLVLTDIAKLQTKDMWKAYKEWRMSSRIASLFWHPKGRAKRRKNSEPNSSDEWIGMGGEQDAEPRGGGGDFGVVAFGGDSCDANHAVAEGPSESEQLQISTSRRGEGSWISGEHVRQERETSWGLKIGAQMEELLEGLARMSVLGISDFLDERRKSSASGGTKYGFETSSLSGLFYSSDPITAASTRWQFRIFTTALCLYVFLLGSLGLMHFVARTQDYAFGPYKHYRLETMLTRNGSVGRAVRGPGVSEFGLIGISGCSPYGSFNLEEHETPEPLPTFAGPLGSSFLVTYPPGGASMTGWYIRTLASGGSEAEDASYFNVWATNEDVDDVEDWSCALGRDDERWWVGGREAEWCGANWRRVGGTHWQWQASSFNTNEDRHMWWDFLPLEISLPVARDALETWQLIPDAILYHPWWILAWIAPVPLALIAVHSRHILLRPVSRFLPSPHVSITSAMVLSVCFGMVTPIYAGVIGANHIMYKNGLGVLAHIWLVIGITFSSSRQAFMVGLIGCGVMRIVSEALLSSWIFHSAWERPPVLGWVVLLLGIAVFVSRQRAVLFSKKLLAGDQVAYDALWQSLYESEDGKACVTHLEKVVRMIGLDANYHCQQQLRLRADKLAPAMRAKFLSQMSGNKDTYPLFWDTGEWFLRGRPDPKSKVSSMGQLYTQSAVASLLLGERVKVWAENSSGMVQLVGNVTAGGLEQQQFARWIDVKRDPAMLKRVKWPEMKRHTRALEKLFRVYHNDPSKLLDVTRSCLVFQNMSDLTNCLGLIITDDNVRVEQIKNRMCPSYDTSQTGGYRDVSRS